MGKCRNSPTKRRTSMGKGQGNNYKNGLRGHSWKGKGKDRVCGRCGLKPKNSIWRSL